MSALFDFENIAWLLVGCEREKEARAMCDWLAKEVPFTGDFNVWTPTSRAIALSARLARLAGDDASAHLKHLVDHPALAVMDRARFDEWVGRYVDRMNEALAEKPSQSSTLSLATNCGNATYFRESAVPGMYYESWLDKAAFDEAIEKGIAGMKLFLLKTKK
jgi:hypothetical protein